MTLGRGAEVVRLAKAIAAAPTPAAPTPAAIIAVLMEHDAIDDVFADDDELDALLREWA